MAMARGYTYSYIAMARGYSLCNDFMESYKRLVSNEKGERKAYERKLRENNSNIRITR